MIGPAITTGIVLDVWVALTVCGTLILLEEAVSQKSNAILLTNKESSYLLFLLLLLLLRLPVFEPWTVATNEIFRVLPLTLTMNEELAAPIMVNVAVINTVSVVQNVWGAAVVVVVVLAYLFPECVDLPIVVPLTMILFRQLAHPKLPLGRTLLCPVTLATLVTLLCPVTLLGPVILRSLPPVVTIIRALPVRQLMDVFGRELLVTIRQLLAIHLGVPILPANAQFLAQPTLSPRSIPSLQSTQFILQFHMFLPRVAVITT